MFIGHWAPALAVAASSRRAPQLGFLFVAAQLTDFAFFFFALIGLEHLRIVPGMTAMNPLDLYHLPYTHSLLGTAFWATGFAALVWRLNRDMVGAILAGSVVLSHWFVDFLVHRPDLTLAGGPARFGLALWDVPVAAIALELSLVAAAFAFYLKRTKGPPIPAFTLLVLMLVLQAVNWFGPPPESADAPFLLAGLAAFTLVALVAWWVGKTRWHRAETGLAVSSVGS
ncbi:hypothetical protein GRI38_04040 [Altererythrobacter aurantiacus]|uniref:Uncharacterized protein n=1 Tax=Parapontixanthobacter aurantiacus TaxID=1463599 RepID=A0A844ZDA4_9SPHN|nr:hypothetical protein [Parapontixanthobacter aurantiacus]MXO85193.1 hypothetical protein [Parapontixanthobacter aurantiacus]